MKGFKLNPDKTYTNKIIEGIHKKEGHCPCQIKQDETTLCPCDSFINEKKCTCNLYILESK